VYKKGSHYVKKVIEKPQEGPFLLSSRYKEKKCTTVSHFYKVEKAKEGKI